MTACTYGDNDEVGDHAIGKTLSCQDMTLRVMRASNGCKGCAFDNGEGARSCPRSVSCMAHLRPDKEPVKFVMMD